MGWQKYLESARIETFVPNEIDPLLALDDLMDINNYSLAERLGEELIRLGLAPTNWGCARSGPAFEARKRRAFLSALEPAGNAEARDELVFPSKQVFLGQQIDSRREIAIRETELRMKPGNSEKPNARIARRSRWQRSTPSLAMHSSGHKTLP